MKRLTALSFASATALLAVTAHADKPIRWDALGAQPAPSRGTALGQLLRPEPEQSVMVYVEFEGEPAAGMFSRAAELADPAVMERVRERVQTLRREHALVAKALERMGVEVVADLARLANALQVRAPYRTLDRLRRMPGVRGVYRVPFYQRSTVTAVPRVGAFSLWGEPGVSATGKGVRVGIIDTGIDYLHANFGGKGDPAEYKSNNRKLIEEGSFPTAKVAGGRDFVGDAYTGSNGASPDPDPLDCGSSSGQGWISGGHGSHVAGIVAGTGVLNDGSSYPGPYLATVEPGTFRIGPGVAPEAQLYALKVFGCDGGTTMVAAALEWAADPNNDDDMSDRLDVVNMSLGSSYDLSSSVDYKQINNLTKLGASVVVAAGNDGDTFFSTGSPGTVTQALSVASTNNGPVYLTMHVLSPSSLQGDMPCAEGDFTKPLLNTGPVSGELVYANPPNGCAPLTNAAEVAGKIAFIDQGTCNAPTKFTNAAAAGAVAVVVADSVESEAPRVMGGAGKQSEIPGVQIRKMDGASIKSKLAEGVTVSLQSGHVYAKALGTDDTSGFSSRGPRSSDGALKPDLAAPGGDIWSTAVATGSGASEKSGTSMACPMVAGGVALMRSFNPSLEPLELKAVLMNTAANLASKKGAPVSVSLGGAGRMTLDEAAANELSAAAAEPAGAVSVSFGSVVAFEPWSAERNIVLRNRGDQPRVVTAKVEPSWQLPGVVATVSAEPVTVPANGTAQVKLKLQVEPSQLPAPQPDDHTRGDLQGMARHFLVEASGRVSFEAEGLPGRRLRVPYHASVRAASSRQAGAVAKCLDDANPLISIPIEGEAWNQQPITTAFELALESPDDFLEPPWTDLLAVGVATSLATAETFEEGSIYFGVAVAGDWTTPAHGQLPTVGVAIDTDLDDSPDFVVFPEAWSKEMYADVMVATLYDLNSDYPVGRRYLNLVPRDEHDLPVFNNSVLVLPVTIGDLGLTQSSAKIGFYAFTHDIRQLSVADSTDMAWWDPTQAFVDTSKNGIDGRPIFGAQASAAVEVDWARKGEAPLPSLLLLHHTNVTDKRLEVLDLQAQGLVRSSDLRVVLKEPAALTPDTTETLVETVLTNKALAPAGKVKVSWSSKGDGEVLDATPSAGSCTGATCDLGDVAPGAVVTIQWLVQPGSSGVQAVVLAQSADGCEKNETDNQVLVELPVVQADAGVPVKAAIDGAVVEGGSCSCSTHGSARGRGPWLLLGALLASIAGRRSSRRRRLHI